MLEILDLRYCTVRVAKTKALISCAVTTQLINRSSPMFSQSSFIVLQLHIKLMELYINIFLCWKMLDVGPRENPPTFEGDH